MNRNNLFRPILAVALLAASVLTASAEKIKISEADALAKAITALDTAIEKPIPQGEGKPDKVILTTFELTGQTRQTLYRNLSALEAELKIWERTKAGFIKEIWGDKQPDQKKAEAGDAEEKARFEKFAAKADPIWQSEVDVKLIKVKLDQLLAKDTNQMPFVLLKALDRIVDGKD